MAGSNNPPNVYSYRDRHGRTRYRIRVRGAQRDVLPPDHPDHQTSYANALISLQERKIAYSKFTLGWLVSDYMKNDFDWSQIKDKTRKDKGGLIARMLEAWGELDVRELKPHILTRLMDDVKAPTTHNRMLGIWRALFTHAKEHGYCSVDPSVNIRRRKYKKTHTHIWTHSERRQFEAYWPSGSKQRLVYALMFYTCQSCADVSHMGRHMENDGFLSGKRVKTSGQFTVIIPDPLWAELRHWRGQILYAITKHGAGYSERGLWNFLVIAIKEAGLPAECTPHGLRGAGLTVYAENNATEKELMEIGGFTNTSEIRIYIREADRRKLAKSAHEKAFSGEPKQIDGGTYE